ncbi:MAG: ABC transporter permease [Treponema sp.]|nr:ABC transporter permease [Treponema sp.]
MTEGIIFGVPAAKIITCVWQTLYMLGVSLIVGVIIGFPLAVILVITRKGGLKENIILYTILTTIINIIRSIPFVILIVAIMPFTKFLVGTRVGSTAALVPLIANFVPFMARLLETSLMSVDKGIIEAGQAMGASTFQLIFRFMLPESLSPIVMNIATGAVALLGATAMAGTVGGGGVGDLAITYGFARFNYPLMISTVIVLIAFVQLLQGLGNLIAGKVKHKK